jgi:hypothetical protein
MPAHISIEARHYVAATRSSDKTRWPVGSMRARLLRPLRGPAAGFRLALGFKRGKLFSVKVAHSGKPAAVSGDLHSLDEG